MKIDRLVPEIKMTITKRQIFSLLLSLIMVISTPALAVSEMADGQMEASMMDCGSMMSDATGTSESASDDRISCFTGSDMACPTASGLNSCGVSIGLLPIAAMSLTLILTRKPRVHTYSSRVFNWSKPNAQFQYHAVNHRCHFRG